MRTARTAWRTRFKMYAKDIPNAMASTTITVSQPAMRRTAQGIQPWSVTRSMASAYTVAEERAEECLQTPILTSVMDTPTRSCGTTSPYRCTTITLRQSIRTPSAAIGVSHNTFRVRLVEPHLQVHRDSSQGL